MSAAPALLLAAGGVGLGHAVLPDHWAPLAVVARTRGYPLARVARLAGLAGVAHVLVSVALGALIVLIGLPLRDAVRHAQDTIVGGLLVATGLAFLVLGRRGGAHHHHHEHGHDHHHGHGHHHHHHPSSQGSGLAAIIVPFGAAASPDLTILPVFLAATAAGPIVAASSVIVFAAVTICTIVGLSVAATAGSYALRGPWVERWGNLLTAVVLVVIGSLVLVGAI